MAVTLLGRGRKILTVKTPPIIAQTLVRKCENDFGFSVIKTWVQKKKKLFGINGKSRRIEGKIIYDNVEHDTKKIIKKKWTRHEYTNCQV